MSRAKPYTEADLREWRERGVVDMGGRDAFLRIVATVMTLESERAVSAAALAGEQRAIQQRDEARAEVERLRAEVGRMRGHMILVADACGNCDGETAHHAVRRLRGDAVNAHAEVKKLRAALRSVAERQREACAARVRPLDDDPELGFTSGEILATPLVTGEE